MRRELFRIPWIDVPVFGYGTMVLLGFLLAYVFVLRAARREGIPREKVQDLPIWMVVSGLLGARLFYFFQFYTEEFSRGRWTRVFAIWEGGLVFYGGFILGATAFVAYCRRQRLPLFRMLDLTAPALAIGLGFGRIGCFLNGCCWGQQCPEEFALGVRFPAGSPPAGFGEVPSAWIHPTQLYSSANAFLLALLLWAVWRARPRPGTVIALLFVGYGISRFVLEGIRGDHAVTPGEWTVSQTISTLTIAVGLVLAILSRVAPGRPVAPPPEGPPGAA